MTNAREVVLRKLTASPRSRAYLADVLAERGIADDVIDEVLDRFTDVGLINDAEYAAMLVRSRHESRGLVGRAMALELSRKGIDAETAAEAMTQIDDESMAQRAEELVQRRIRSLRGVPRQVAHRRLAGMLARKGYGPGVIYRVLGEAMAEWGAEADEDQ